MINLTQKQLQTVKTLLRPYLTDDRKVFAFGSRTNNTSQKFSDLDLLIAGKRLSFIELATIREAFSESDFPYFVDLVQKESLDDKFYDLIKGNFEEITL